MPPVTKTRMNRSRCAAIAVAAVILVTGLAGLSRVTGARAAARADRSDGPARVAMPFTVQTSSTQGLPFGQSWADATMIFTNDNWSGVPGIVGFRGDDITTPTGVDPQLLLQDGSGTPVNVIANQTNPNTLGTGGVAEFDGIANPVVALQGSGTADVPHIVMYLNTTFCSNIQVAYNVRDIDGSTDNAVQQVALHMRIGNSGTYTNLPAGYIPDATTGPSTATLVTPILLTLPVTAENQSEVQLRVMTTNAAGNDEWVGIDDISVSGTCATPTPTLPPSATPTPSASPTASDTPVLSPTPTNSPTPSNTPTNTPTATPTNTPTPTSTSTNTPTATATNTPTSTPTRTNTPTATPTPTPPMPLLAPAGPAGARALVQATGFTSRIAVTLLGGSASLSQWGMAAPSRSGAVSIFAGLFDGRGPDAPSRPSALSVPAPALTDPDSASPAGRDAPDQVVLPNIVVAQAHDPCPTGLIDLQVTVTNTGSAAVVNNPGFPELRISHDGGYEATTCTTTAGTCNTAGANLAADFALPVGQSVTVRWTVRIVGGIGPAVTGGPNNAFNVTACAIWDFNGSGAIDAAESDCLNSTAPAQLSTSRVAITCPKAAQPNDQLGRQVHLPVLNYEAQSNVCQTWIEVQQIGCEKAKAALVVWGAPGFCPPQAAGPLKVECTGLLKPGSTWSLLGAQIPTGAKSGMLFKFTARQLVEIGIDLGFDDVTADYMCETLFFSVVGDNDSFRRFKKAFNEGEDYAGLPMDLASGGGFLAVDVLRKCPGDVTPGISVASEYDGLAGAHLGAYDEDFGGYGYYVPLVYATKGGAAGAVQGAFNSIMYIQNGGLECSSVEVWFKAQDDCLRNVLCSILTLAPGETYQLDASSCVGPDWQGSAWLRASEPLGVAVDVIGRDVLMTYIAEPSEINATPSPDNAEFTPGNQVAFGPLVYSEYQGWDAGVQVQNLSRIVSAKVKVYFHDQSGDVITTLVDWICPGGSQTFFLPLVADLPGTWVGSVRVESQEWISPGSPGVQSPNIVGVATLVRYSDAARTNTREALAYNLLPEHKAFDWQLGSAGGGTSSGVGLIAIPSLIKEPTDGDSTTSELAIANLVPKPGKTDFAIFVYDQNGFIDYVCQVLNQNQVEYIDLASWGYVPPHFRGSAVISATFWEHDVFDGEGHFLRNLLGLGAVAIHRRGASLGDDGPGDEASGDRGIPFALSDPGTRRCAFALAANQVIHCPGVPGGEPASACPKRFLVAKCGDCPEDIPDNGGNFPNPIVPLQSAIEVSAPAGCLVKDVDVWVSINHAFWGDVDAGLTSPAGTTVELFTDICTPGRVQGSLGVVFDDEATTPIWAPGKGCSQLQKFGHWNIENPATLPTLTSFEGQDPAGPWTITVVDDFGGSLGKLLYWELEFELK